MAGRGRGRVSVTAPSSEKKRDGAAGGGRLVRWRVKQGGVVGAGQVLGEWSLPDAGGGGGGRLRAPIPGRIVLLTPAEGELFEAGATLAEIEPCTHPTVMKDMCADCGADLYSDDDPQTNIASVPMIHSVPELKVSEELAMKIGKEDRERLIKDRKLVLLVDLDQTLIHTTNNNIPENIKDVYHFRLRSNGPGSFGVGRWYHTRLRPGTSNFLRSITNYFELHICTFGARAYAHQVAELLDPNGELFSHRILSRDECIDIYTKTANLKALFPCGDNLVCIIDDREDVWNGVTNLIQVKPYHFFEHTGDINAPPCIDRRLHDIQAKQNIVNAQSRQEAKKAKQSEEMPSLDGENQESEDKSNSNDKIDAPDDNKVESKDDEAVESPDDESPKEDPIEPSNEPVIEKDIVKDIEKIVTQVQENFMNTDSIGSKTNSVSPKDSVNNDQAGVDGAEADSRPPDPRSKWKMTDDGLIDVEDSDDYLLYLEEILIRIHKLFYEIYDTMEAGTVPDLKAVIPQVKGKVLAGTSLVFSGLVPTHQKLEHSRAFMVAQSLGAEVTQNVTDRTTHLVAVRSGTAKVHACRRLSANGDGTLPHIVTPAWLWCCAERWQHVEEKLFPLCGAIGKFPRRPPPHCGSPPRLSQNHNTTLRKRTPSGRFMDTLNPLLSFSSDDIADMDKEVEDMINESDESDSEDRVFDDKVDKPRIPEDKVVTEEDVLKEDFGNISSDSDDSIASLTGEYPHGWKPDRARKRQRSKSCDDEDTVPSSPKQFKDVFDDNKEDVNSDNEELPSVKFKQGEDITSDGIDKNDSDTDDSVDAPDDLDDGEWNMMGAALEREFLGLDK